MKFAVFGTGGMGAYFGGRLARAGHDVWFIARGRNLAAMRDGGLRIESPTGNFTVNPVQATDDPAKIGPVDYVLYCVKLYDVDSTKHALKPLLGPQTSILTLQNGIDVVDMLAPVVGRERLMPGASYVSSNIFEPGLIRHVGAAGHIDFGEPDGKISARAKALIAAFDKAGFEVRFREDIIDSLWQKFVLVCTFSGVMTLTRAPIGVVRATPETLRLLADAGREAVAVARASGINLPADFAESMSTRAQGMAPELKPSLLEDLEHGRRMEVDWFSGTIVRLGEKLGIPTPVHRVIHAALKPHANGA